ncbi:YfhO family protein [Candidatus Gottesmanbacteria bacterium]|nr:YfhO family protein [Candidatus Gottesmanbacteria bacterium]
MKRFFPLFVLLAIVAIFFYKTFLYGLIPFPGDLLLAEYKPWQSYSFAGYVPGSIPNKAQYPDTIRQLYPWRTLATNELRSGRMPLWNPYNFSGTPLLANFQSAAFYPPNILYVVFPQTVAWSMLVILQPLLSLLFTYWYIRKIDASLLAAILAGISYAFSLFAIVWLQYNSIGHVMIWLPLMLLAIESLKRQRTRSWFALLVAAEASALLAGHPQLGGYLLLFVLAYTFFLARPLIKNVTLSMLFALGIAAIQLIPGMELVWYAARSSHEFSLIFQKILIQPQQLFMTIIPNLFGHPATRTYWPQDTFIGKVTYVGLVPLFFLLAAFRIKSRHIKFFGISSLIVLVLVTANPITFILYKFNLPLFSSSSPTLMEFLLAFSLAVITSLGLDGWIQEKHSIGKLAHRSLSVIIFFIIIWLGFRSIEHSRTAMNAILYSGVLATIILSGFFIAITRKKFMIPVVLLLIALHTTDLFIQFQKFNPFVPASFVFPQTSIIQYLKEHAGNNRFWGYGTASIQTNIATQYQIYSTDGYDPLYPKWYGELLNASKNGQILKKFTNDTRSDAILAQGFGEFDLPNNQYRLRMLDALSVKYILDRPENGSTQNTLPQDRFQPVADIDGWKVYENLKAAPRAFLVSDFATYASPKEFEDHFFSKEFNPSTAILLEKPINERLGQINGTSVQIKKYQPNEVSLDLVSNGNLLYLSDTYYPGWKAFIDEANTPILKANYAFRAIYVPRGAHTVRFIFDPLSFKIGLVVSVISLAASIIFLKKYEA